MQVEWIAGMKDQERLLTLAQGLSVQNEVHQLLDMLDSVIEDGGGYRTLDVLETVRQGKRSRTFNVLALHINSLARKLANADSAVSRAPLIRSLAGLRERLRNVWASPAPNEAGSAEAAVVRMSLEAAIVKVYQLVVWRTPHESEIETWVEHLRNDLPFHEFLLLMCNSPEAKVDAHGSTLLRQVGDGKFVLLAHEHTQGRGAGAAEMNHWLHMLERGEVSRIDTLCRLFISGVAWAEQRTEAPTHDGLSCRIMGTQRDLTAADWARQARDRNEDVSGNLRHIDHERYRQRFHIHGEPKVLVSAITSLYRGGEFIEQFMDNITSQDGFDDYCELVIVDADSPENEAETIRRYLARHKNINYIRMNYRIGIYDAWNVAAQAARGEYLTNANLDDLRRHDSFLLQAGTLDNLPFVDVVYQDLYYTFDPRLSFEEIAAFGHQTNLPVVTLHNMVEYNSPHNAPMWRKRLHDEIGYFDTHFRSAGDYEFWFRCLAADKIFYKINDPHVVYYQNPNGLSTRPDSRGVVEAMEVHRRYCRKLIPDEALVSTEEFIRILDPSNTSLLKRSGAYRYQIAHDALRDVARKQKFGS